MSSHTVNDRFIMAARLISFLHKLGIEADWESCGKYWFQKD